MKKRTWWVLGIAAVLAVVAAIRLWPDPAIAVETATIMRGALRVTVDDEGRTRVRERYVVAAPVAGRLARMAVDEGDAVSAGALLARIAPAPEDPRATSVARGQLAAAEARQAEAQAGVERAHATADQADRDLDRAQKLTTAGALSQDALEQARLAQTSARRQVEMQQAAAAAAAAQVAAARAALIGTNPAAPGGMAVDVRAPGAGRVLRVLEKSARVVQAGAPLVEIGDASGLELVVPLLSEEAVQVTPGDPVLIDQWGGQMMLQGRVRLVEPEGFTKISALGVEEQRVNVIVDLTDPPPSLGAGYRVEAHVVTWTGDNLLVVPTSALFQQGTDWTVFVVQEGRAARRTIEIGHRSADAAEVLGGLREGDVVLLYPSASIADGVAVRQP